MALIAIPKETRPGEKRVPVNPATAKKLVSAGADVQDESGAAAESGYSEQDYT